MNIIFRITKATHAFFKKVFFVFNNAKFRTTVSFTLKELVLTVLSIVVLKKHLKKI